MHSSGTHRYSLFSIVIFISILSTPVARCETITEQDKHVELSSKLDLVLDRLDRLNQTVISLSSCGCKNNNGQSNITKTNDDTVRYSSDADTSSTITKRDAGREDSLEAPVSKDLFPFNKLADNLSNSIPSSSSKEQLYGSLNTGLDGSKGSLERTSGGGGGGDGLLREERILAPISRHYESLFGTALDNLSLIIREHLTGFRLTLNKLMNRISDHNYQHNVLVSQLSLVKDECSLAATYSLGVAANMTCFNESSSSPARSTVAQSSPKPIQADGADRLMQPMQNTLRSSDITMMVRLLSEELNQLIQKSAATMVREQQLARVGQTTSKQGLHCDQQQPETTEQERRLNLDTSIDRELKSFGRHLAEIDSVVKQTAHLMNKLASHSPLDSFNVQPLGLNRHSHHHHQHEQQLYHRREGHLDDSQQLPRLTTLTYTNANEANETSPAANQLAVGQTSSNNNKTSSRWFSGSKVPNRRQNGSPAANSSRQVPKCQAKTSLVRPTSCRHLREAGANCTGQYYVFIRGSIRHVYCDMNMDSSDDGGGWTVVLRRIDKSLTVPAEQQHLQTSTSSLVANRQPPHQSSAMNWLEAIKAAQLDFSQDWTVYKNGLGQLDNWSEFFVGLDLLHQLTTNWPNRTNSTAADSAPTPDPTVELQMDLMTNASHELHLKFDDFHIEDEVTNYRLQVGNCNSSDTNQCQPILRLNGSKFYTPDKIYQEFCINGTNDSVTMSPAEGGRDELVLNKMTNGGEKGGRPVLEGWWWPISGELAASSTNTSLNTIFNCDPFKKALRNLPACTTDGAYCPLTAPIGRPSKSYPEASHLYWPHWQHAHEPIVQLVLKVRQRRVPQ